jgi:hypothetical protein
MKYQTVTLLIPYPENEGWDCGCDQTFALGRQFHFPEKKQYLIAHSRGCVDNPKELKIKVFNKEGGI